MPRDWDLLSYTAVPMSILLAYALLNRHATLRLNRAILTLAVILAGVSAVARVSTQFMPSMALRQVEDYLELDKLKAKGATILLQTYFAEARNREEFDRWGQLFLAYADERLIIQADTLMAQNRLMDAMVRLNQARQRNPMNAVLYSRMSVIYLRLGRVDEAKAAIDTALGLSPSNPDALVGKGFFLQRDGKLTEAERSYIRATETGPDRSLAWFYLARLRQSQGNTAEYVRCLDSAAAKSDAAPEVHVELCNAYIARGRWQEAAEALRNGLERGLSGQVVERMLQSHPEVQRYWGR
jgi:tetratricopeptide (TPR) repeat protein